MAGGRLTKGVAVAGFDVGAYVPDSQAGAADTAAPTIALTGGSVLLKKVS